MVVALVGMSVLTGVSAFSASRPTATRYLLRSDPSETMPYRIVLTRSCRNSEDVMSRLRVVDYTPEKVVYRCIQP
jgi:hypothetical protein